LAAVGPGNRLQVLRPAPAGLERPVQDWGAGDVHPRCLPLVHKRPRLVAACDVLDLKVSHAKPPVLGRRTRGASQVPSSGSTTLGPRGVGVAEPSLRPSGPQSESSVYVIPAA